MKLYLNKNYLVTKHDCESCLRNVIFPRILSFTLQNGLTPDTIIQYPQDFLGVHGMLELMRRTHLHCNNQQIPLDFIYGKMNQRKFVQLWNRTVENNLGGSVRHILNAKYNEFKINTVYHFFLQYCPRAINGKELLNPGYLAISNQFGLEGPDTRVTSDTFVNWMYDAMFPNRRTMFKKEWRTQDVIGVARGIFDTEKFDRMPILADALEEAGCDLDLVLHHLRTHTEFTRASWVLSFILQTRRFK